MSRPDITNAAVALAWAADTEESIDADGGFWMAVSDAPGQYTLLWYKDADTPTFSRELEIDASSLLATDPEAEIVALICTAYDADQSRKQDRAPSGDPAPSGPVMHESGRWVR